MKVFVIFLLLVCMPLCATDSGKYEATGMGLTSVPKNVDRSVDKMNMENNLISSADADSWTNLKNLNFLSLENNAFTTILNDTFTGLRRLEHLIISNNKITNIETGGLCHLKDLKRLEIQFNKLTHLPPEVLRCVDLNYLDVSDNRLTTFVMEYHGELTLGLRGNPMYCDCRMKWIKDGEQNGSIDWAEDEYDQPLTPNCVNFPEQHWDDIDLLCSAKDCPAGYYSTGNTCEPDKMTQPPEGPTPRTTPLNPTTSSDEKKVDDIKNCSCADGQPTEKSTQSSMGPAGWVVLALLIIVIILVVAAAGIFIWKRKVSVGGYTMRLEKDKVDPQSEELSYQGLPLNEPRPGTNRQPSKEEGSFNLEKPSIKRYSVCFTRTKDPQFRAMNISD